MKLYTITPCRVIDTRFSPPAVHAPRGVQVAGSCGVPLEATGIAGNLTAIPYGSGGYLNIYATGTSPATSTLNFNPGVVRANNFQLGLSGNGQATLVASTPVDAIVDVVGYFAHDAPTWTVTLRDEANRLASEYTVPPPGTAISLVKNYFYLGNLLVATRNSAGGYTYFASDHLGTPRVGTGAEPVTRKFQPFGLEIPGASGGLSIKFAAMERDVSSGNDFDHARYQSSLLGRFLGSDKVGGTPADPQSWNRYAYALNNPLAYVDPDGQSATLAAAVVGGAVSGGLALLQGRGLQDAAAAAAGGALAGALVGSVFDTGGATLGVLLAAGGLGAAEGRLFENLVAGRSSSPADIAFAGAQGVAGAALGTTLGATAQRLGAAPAATTSLDRLAVRSDITLAGGRSGQSVKSLVGPANSAVRGGPGRIFVTDSKGRVAFDITAGRVKAVGFGGKRLPTKEELALLQKVLGPN
jgi:RHS repeat-associated protein